VGGPAIARQCATKSLADTGAAWKNLFIRVGRRNFTLTCWYTTFKVSIEVAEL